MSDFRTDEESIELVKAWWKDNGTFLLVGLALVLAAVFGWQFWQKHRAEQAVLAAQRFEQLRDALQPDSRTPPQTRAFLLQQLKEVHSDTGYGVLGALLEARRLVDGAQFDAASKELEWAISNAKNKDVADLAGLRLARVRWAKGDADAALKQLEGIDSKGYVGLVEELRGDLLLWRGDRGGAYAAYQRALDADKDAVQPLLTMKRDDVAPVGKEQDVSEPVANEPVAKDPGVNEPIGNEQAGNEQAGNENAAAASARTANAARTANGG